MNLTTEQKLAINLKVARDMWPDTAITSSSSIEGAALVDRSFLFNIFDPEKGDLNKAAEFYAIDVVCNKLYDVWCAGQSVEPQLRENVGYPFIEKDRIEVVQQAVIAASGASQTK